MKKGVLVWMIVGASLILLGILLFVGVMWTMKWDFLKLSATKYETNTSEIDEEFENITIEAITADVAFLPSDDGVCRVVCYEQTKVKHAVEVSEGTLTVKAVDTRAWYDYIGIFSVGNPIITVYLPSAEYESLSVKTNTGDVGIPTGLHLKKLDISGTTGNVSCYASVKESMRIKMTTGDILVKDITAGSAELSVSTGRVEVSDLVCEGNLTVRVSTGKTVLSDLSCANLYSDGTTGDLYLRRVIAGENFHLERSTGDVELEGCDAAEIFVQTDTGDVVGSLLTDKVFLTQTDTGSIRVPSSVTGGRCEIITDTGDIDITIG